MGLKFRKSIKMGPVRINLSKSGIGYSVGTKGARITKSAKGKTRATVGIPGTGLSYSKSIGSKKKKASSSKSKATSNARKSKSVSSANATQPNSFDTAEPFKKSIPLAILSAVITFFFVGGIIFIGLIIVLLVLSLFGVINSNGAWFDFVLFGVPITLGILSAVIVFRYSVPEKPENAEAVPDLESHPEAEREVAPPPKDPRIEQFENAMQAIPRVEIPVSEPAPKHLLKDLPDYSFSNITRTTRMDSIFPLVFLDVETTGLYPSRCEIIEVSAIKFDFGMVPVSCFTTLCKPNKPIPEEASAVNHLQFQKAAFSIINWIRSALITASNGKKLTDHCLIATQHRRSSPVLFSIKHPGS